MIELVLDLVLRQSFLLAASRPPAGRFEQGHELAHTRAKDSEQIRRHFRRHTPWIAGDLSIVDEDAGRKAA
jgi:hypothetical protein